MRALLLGLAAVDMFDQLAHSLLVSGLQADRAVPGKGSQEGVDLVVFQTHHVVYHGERGDHFRAGAASEHWVRRIGHGYEQSAGRVRVAETGQFTGVGGLEHIEVAGDEENLVTWQSESLFESEYFCSGVQSCFPWGDECFMRIASKGRGRFPQHGRR